AGDPPRWTRGALRRDAGGGGRRVSGAARGGTPERHGPGRWAPRVGSSRPSDGEESMSEGRPGGFLPPAKSWRLLAAAVVALALATRLAGAQTPGAGIEEQLILENDTVRVALLVFPPGSASGEHSGLDPELGIVLEGELTLLTPAGRE